MFYANVQIQICLSIVYYLDPKCLSPPLWVSYVSILSVRSHLVVGGQGAGALGWGAGAHLVIGTWQHGGHMSSDVLRLELETKATRRFAKISQSRRRPLLGPSPD